VLVKFGVVQTGRRRVSRACGKLGRGWRRIRGEKGKMRVVRVEVQDSHLYTQAPRCQSVRKDRD